MKYIILVLVLAGLAACQPTSYDEGKHVDWPEEPVQKGDLLEVGRVTDDSVYLQYMVDYDDSL